MSKLKKIILICSMLVSANLAAGEIDFSGFATIAGGLTTDKDERLLGYDDSFNINENSLFGLQAHTEINDKWGATAQIVARGNEAWNTEFSWAYVSYDATDDWRLLFGRQRVPFYMYSDFIDVSYAYHWITGPETVYSLPFDDFDGVGSIYTSSLGDFDSTLHVTFGRNSDELRVAGAPRPGSNIGDLFSAAWTLNRDWLTLRLGYSRADVTIPVDDIQPLVDGWNGLANFPLGDLSFVADGIEIADDEFTFAAFAVIVDYENFLAVAEFTKLDDDESNFIAQQDSFYVSLGYRVNDVLFHYTHSENDASNSTAILDTVPLGIDPGLDFLAASTAGALTAQNDESSYDTIGLRWEADAGVALKVEFTQFDNTLNPSGDATLVRFAVVTVF